MTQQITISTFFTRLSHKLITVFHVGSPVMLQRMKPKSESLPFQWQITWNTLTVHKSQLNICFLGMVLVVLRDRLENWFWSLVWLQRPIYCPVIGHNLGSLPRRHLYLMGLSNNPTCRECGTEEETSVHILYECEALVSLRHAHLGSFFLDHTDIMNISRGAIWNFGNGTRFL